MTGLSISSGMTRQAYMTGLSISSGMTRQVYMTGLSISSGMTRQAYMTVAMYLCMTNYCSCIKPGIRTKRRVENICGYLNGDLVRQQWCM